MDKKEEHYSDFLKEVKIPMEDRWYCKSCEMWIPKENPIHTCYNAKEIRETNERLRRGNKMNVRVSRIIRVLKVIAKYILKELSEQIRISKEVKLAGVFDDLPEPLRTKEKKRYLELIKDSKILRDYLDE